MQSPRKYETDENYPHELSYGWQAWARDHGIDVGYDAYSEDYFD